MQLKWLSVQLWTFSVFFYFLFKSFVKIELSYAFTLNLFNTIENGMESDVSYENGCFSLDGKY